VGQGEIQNKEKNVYTNYELKLRTRSNFIGCGNLKKKTEKDKKKRINSPGAQLRETVRGGKTKRTLPDNSLTSTRIITTKMKRKELVDREDEGFSSYPEGVDAAAAASVGDLTLTGHPVR